MTSSIPGSVTPSLEAPMGRLDGTLSNLSQWMASLPITGIGSRWSLNFQVDDLPTQPFYHSVILWSIWDGHQRGFCESQNHEKKKPFQWHMSSVLARTERDFGRNLARFECTRQIGMLDYTLKFLWTSNYWKRNNTSDYLSTKICMNCISVLRWLKRDRSGQR